MLTNLIKFIHLLSVLGLCGLTIYCLILISSAKFSLSNSHIQPQIVRVNKSLLFFLLVGVVTGTLLVYPKHFTFHTPWIQAAFAFVLICIGSVAGLIFLQKKFHQAPRIVWFLSYLSLILIFIAIIHDAVTKTTLF